MSTQLKETMVNKLKESGMSYSQLGREIGLSRGRIHQIFHATDNPGVHTIAKIAKVLNCSIDELLNPQKDSYSKAILKNPELFKESLGELVELAKEQNIELTLEQLIKSTKEIYAYSSQTPTPNKVDRLFASWVFKSNFL
jgi:transcriptional regulator with XRE-family HTH domain